MIVVEQHGSGRGLVAFERRDRRAIQKIDVEPAVVVVVEQGHARARSFDDRFFFRGSGAMVKFVETRLFCDVVEHDGSIVHKAAGGDRTRLGVFNCGMCGAGGDASARR